MSRTWFYQAVAGIGVIFILNLFVSFSIAAYVGLRAYDVSGREQLEILRFLVVNGLKSPLRFIWPSYMRTQGGSDRIREEESRPTLWIVAASTCRRNCYQTTHCCFPAVTIALSDLQENVFWNGGKFDSGPITRYFATG